MPQMPMFHRMRGVLVGAILIFALMLVIKDGRASRNLGLTGSCHVVAAPAGQDGLWQACRPGKLEGAPDLSRYGCKSTSHQQARVLALPSRHQEQPRHVTANNADRRLDPACRVGTGPRV